MSCRTTFAGSAYTTYARLANGGLLSDVATLSTFHHLRSVYSSRGVEAQRVYSEEEYRAMLQRQIERVNRRAEALTESRTTSLLARLEQAVEAPMPDQATVYALANLNPAVRNRGTALNRFADENATALGLTSPEFLAEFQTLELGIDRSRGAGNPETYTEENIAAAREAGISTEAGSVHAFVTLRDRVRRAAADEALTHPRRIELVPVTNSTGSEAGYLYQVVSAGYDERNQRLEVVVRDTTTGAETTRAYRGISREMYNRGFDGRMNSTYYWEESIRGNSSYAYASQIDADLEGAAPRCPTCGQYANSTHSCPVVITPHLLDRRTTSRNWSNQVPSPEYLPEGLQPSGRRNAFLLPAVTEIRPAFNEGPVSVGISDYVNGFYIGSRYYGAASVSGNLVATRDAEAPGGVGIDASGARCNCSAFRENGTCLHLQFISGSLRTRLAPIRRPASTMTAEERTLERTRRLAAAQAEATAAAVSDWTRNEATLAEARRTWHEQAEVSYSEDFSAFERDYNAAVAAKAAAGGTAVPYMRENALGGLAQRGSGQAFGMEIEYEFAPGVNKREANAAIGRELHAAGLARQTTQEYYHSAANRSSRAPGGLIDTHADSSGTSNWSWENDGSVGGGELVSPAMYDEPETWEKLEKAVEILRRHGAIPTKHAGAHVHVGTSKYGGDPAKYTELARLMTQHEDVITRLAADPSRGTHRNNQYSQPLNSVPVDGFEDVRRLRTWQAGRYRTLNFYNVSSNASDAATDHPEFRIFDSSLDPGTMQAQIKLSVAMTEAAARIAEVAPTTRPKEPVGSHARRVKAWGRRVPTSEQLQEDTATFRSLMDTLFTRAADKAQMTSVFAHNKWTARRG